MTAALGDLKASPPTGSRTSTGTQHAGDRGLWSLLISIAVCFRLEWQTPLGGSAVFPCVFLSI